MPFLTSMLVRSRNGSAISRQNSSCTPSGRRSLVRSTQRATESLAVIRAGVKSAREGRVVEVAEILESGEE